MGAKIEARVSHRFKATAEQVYDAWLDPKFACGWLAGDIQRLEIDAQANGCAATIVHELDEEWVDYVSRTEYGWARMLQRVDNLLG